MKKSHILSYTHETLVPLEVINIPKFYEDRTKNVDFLLIASFESVSVFSSDFTNPPRIM